MYAACAAIFDGGVGQQLENCGRTRWGAGPSTLPPASVIEQPVQQAAAVETAKAPESGDVSNAMAARFKRTDTLMSGSADLKAAHQTTDPLQCLLAWVQSNQKNNPYLKTCEASPPKN